MDTIFNRGRGVTGWWRNFVFTAEARRTRGFRLSGPAFVRFAAGAGAVFVVFVFGNGFVRSVFSFVVIRLICRAVLLQKLELFFSSGNLAAEALCVFAERAIEGVAMGQRGADDEFIEAGFHVLGAFAAPSAADNGVNALEFGAIGSGRQPHALSNSNSAGTRPPPGVETLGPQRRRARTGARRRSG